VENSRQPGEIAHVTSTTRHVTSPPVFLHTTPIPVTYEVKYLGLHLDRRLTWRKHIQTKRQHLDHNLRAMSWLLGRRSQLSLSNKILLYICVLKPVWTYGIQLWGCAKPSHTQILQRFQSKLLRTLANAPWYVSNLQLHTDLGISFAKFRNLQIIPPLPPPTSWAPKCPCCSPVHTPNVARRLKRRWPSDLHSVTSD